MIQHPFILLFVLAFGACVGSFLNVVIHRLPRNMSVNKPTRSFCPSCEKQIPMVQNIPILSWILLRGKCANCKAPISVRYVLVEFATMILFLLVWLRFAPLEGWGYALSLWILVALLIAATFIDFEHQIIPDSLNFGGAAVAIFLAAFLPILDNWFPTAGVLRVNPDSNTIPNEIWYRGLLWSLVGAGVGYGLIWSIVHLGKLVFGKKEHSYKEPQNWVIHQPDPDKNPLLEIGEERLSWEDMFNRPSDKLILDTENVTIHIRDGESTTPREFETDQIIVRMSTIEVGEETLKLEDVLKLEGKSSHFVQPREAMGLGDVKFVMMIGAFLGWKATLLTLMFGAFAGSIGGILQKRLGGERWSQPIPFGPYLAIGAFIYLFYGEQILHWYFRMGR